MSEDTPATATETTPAPASTPAPAVTGETTPAGAKTPTAANVDDNPAWLPERLERAKKSTIDSLLKDLGASDLEALRAELATGRKASEAALSEAEKLAKRAEKAEAEKAALEAKLAEAETARRVEKLTNAVTMAAQTAHAEYPSDVVDYLQKNHADDLQTALSEEGEVVIKTIDGLIAKAKAARPGWFGTGGNGVGSPSNRGGKLPNPEDKKQQDILNKIPKIRL